MLNLFLGNRCNFSCDYCLQPKGEFTPVTPDLAGIISYIRENNVKNIGYWGGEPLLYWDTITFVHDALVAAGLEFELVLLISNGSLLDAEKVAYINAKGFYVTLSDHEPFGQINWRMAARLKKSSISFLVTRVDLTLWGFRDFIYRLMDTYNREFFVAVGYVRATSKCPEKFYLRNDDVKIHMAHLADMAVLKDKGDLFARLALHYLLGRWKRAFTKPYSGQSLCCHNGKMTIDLAGSVYPCHYCASPADKIGTLNAYNPGPVVTRHISTEKCRECEAVPWCRGNCYLSRTHETDCDLALSQHNFFKELNNGLPALHNG